MEQGYRTPTLRSLLKEASKYLDPFNNNEHKELYSKIQVELKFMDAAQNELHALAEKMADSYETGESQDMNAAVNIYRIYYPKNHASDHSRA